MTGQHYLRHPHLAHNLLTFVADDDVWLAEVDQASAGTARAWRLTSDRTPVLSPRLNPAGTHVAWSAIREGAREAFAVAVDGGPIRQLTYWGERSRETAGVRGWISDDEVLVTGWNGHHEGMRVWPYAVPLEGPERALPYGPLTDLSISAGGAVLVGSGLYREPARWKRYLGGTGGKIWYSPDGGEYRRILAEVGNHLVHPMWVDGRVAFLSDHEGVGALYSANPDGSDLRRHSDHGPYYARHASTDGSRVVYQVAGELWLLESLDAEPVALGIRLGGVRAGRAPISVGGGAGLGSYSLCRSGRIVAAEVRGTVHWLPAEQGPSRALLAEPGVRARIPLILPGTSTVVCASDSDGEDGIDVIPADGSPARRILSGQVGRVIELAAAPDAKTLALSCDDGRLLIVDLESGAARELARAENHQPHGLTFSPDSALLAWSQDWRSWGGAWIRLARLADDSVVDVTAARFHDFSPAFTADGKYLAFLSSRTFDPVEAIQPFDLSFVPGVRPYLVTLAADTPSPFAPELNGRPAKPKQDAKDKDGDKAADGEAEGEPSVEPVRLDLEGLAARIVPFPVPAGTYQTLRAAGSAVLWLDSPRTGELGEAVIGGEEHPKPSLVRFDLAKRKQSTLVEALDDYAVSGDGSRLGYRKDGEFTIRPTEGSGDEENIAVDLERIRVTVDPASEWRQMYAENWRLMRDNFWREDMAGVDWPGIRERYEPLLERVGTSDELRDVLWEAVAELGASHAYVRDPYQLSPIPAGQAQGRLGADLVRDEQGRWLIGRIVPSETSVLAAFSPLEAPGVAARAGDEIVAVDGRAVDPDRGPNPLLVGKARKPVELTLRRDGEERRVAVVPLRGEGTLRYQDLIRTRRAAVHERSGGRLGYLHVPDMSMLGWAEFHRDLITELAREGLVFDLRENGGGFTSELVIEKLRREVIGWDLGRRTRPNSYPGDAPRGPIVALTDENAGSDGDIGTHAFKRYGLGPVIGTRTWGGVIGIDGKYGLVDGTEVTQPKYSFWFDDAGWSVENYGVDPDVDLPIAPHDYAAGRDPQLDEAIRTALAALEERPAVTPPGLPPVR